MMQELQAYLEAKECYYKCPELDELFCRYGMFESPSKFVGLFYKGNGLVAFVETDELSVWLDSTKIPLFRVGLDGTES